MKQKRKALTPRQIQCVQDSFALIVPRRAEAAALFYERLFTLAPDTRSLFKSDLSEQGAKLMQVLATIVRHLEDLAPLLDSIDYLAHRHVQYGVRSEHYSLVGQALLDTLEASLGEAFCPETEEAWAKAYGVLSSRMIAASQGGRRLAA